MQPRQSHQKAYKGPVRYLTKTAGDGHAVGGGMDSRQADDHLAHLKC